jgi:hypothetical protein
LSVVGGGVGGGEEWKGVAPVRWSKVVVIWIGVNARGEEDKEKL